MILVVTINISRSLNYTLFKENIHGHDQCQQRGGIFFGCQSRPKPYK